MKTLNMFLTIMTSTSCLWTVKCII